MALRDLWRGGRREREHERERYPLDPLSRDSWRDEAEARYGARDQREHAEERQRSNDRWENSYSGPGSGRFGSRQDQSYDQAYEQNRGGESSYGGTGGNPFYGDHPLMRAGSSYDSSYFGSKTGLPTTQWRDNNDNADFDDLVYGGRSMDADATSASAGQHRGRGPRGYRRSDERIKEDVCQCLTDDRHIDATNIEVAVSDREVMLSGTVSSRMQKRHAEELIERLPGVRDVINSLRVVSESERSQSTNESGAQSTTQSTRLGGNYR